MASFTGNGFGCACGREQCDDNCPTYRNYMKMPSYPRLNGGQCGEVNCPYRTSFGYCYYSACINPKYCTFSYTVEQRPTTNADRIRAMTDEELAKVMSGDCDLCIDRISGVSHNCRSSCYECWLDWLKQEVDT